MNDGSGALFHWFLVVTEIRDEKDALGYLIIFQYQRDEQMFLGHIYHFFT